MKVSELINILFKMNPDADVNIYDNGMCYDAIIYGYGSGDSDSKLDFYDYNSIDLTYKNNNNFEK